MNCIGNGSSLFWVKKASVVLVAVGLSAWSVVSLAEGNEQAEEKYIDYKLILSVCNDDKGNSKCEKDIQSMDEALGFLYQYVYTFSLNKYGVEKNSNEFKGAFNRCEDKACMADLFGNQVGYMLDQLDETMISDSDKIKGLWYSGDAVSFSNYGSFLMTDNYLYWGVGDAYGNALLSSNAKKICRSKYKIIEDTEGTVFFDSQGREYIINAESEFDTLLVKQFNSTCQVANSQIGGFRLTVSSRNERKMSLIEYDEYGKPGKTMEFIR